MSREQGDEDTERDDADEGELLDGELVDGELGDVPLPDDDVIGELPSFRLPEAPSEALAVSDPLTTYLAQLRHIAPLPAEQQQELAIRYVEHGDLEAAKALIMSNLRLVVKIAREYHRRRVNLMELVQEGNVGLAEAIRRYDPHRGVKFTSYAQYWVRAMILNYLMNVMQLVKVGNTRAGRKLFYNLQKAREQLIQQGFLTPSTRQLADHLGVKESEVVDVARILDQPALSIDAPAPGHDATPLGALIADDAAEDPGSIAEQRDLSNVIRQALDAFRDTLSDDRERTIWDRRVTAEEPASLQELGDDFNVSRERIRQVEKLLKDRFRTFWIDSIGADESAIILNE